MGDCFYFAEIELQSSFDERFSITGRTGGSDFYILWKNFTDFVDRLDRRF